MQTFTYIFTLVTFIFAIGSMFGWVLELFYRRWAHGSWVNPGFLIGPCLPIYGFGLIALFILSYLPAINGTPDTIQTIIAIILMGILMTVIEYIAGIIFIKIMKIKLWDYSTRWGNIQGIICPLFSLIWTVLAAGYYFYIQPYILKLVLWLTDNIFYGFFVGIFFGVFIVDVCYSIHIVARIKKFAEEKQIIVHYDELKAHVKQLADEGKQRVGFLFTLRPELPFEGALKRYEQNYKQRLAERFTKKK